MDLHDIKYDFVRNLRLIQTMVITLEGGGKLGDGLFFTNLNYVKIRDNYM